MSVKIEEKFPNIFVIDGKLATVNLAPGKRVYGEKLVNVKGTEYRLWDPFRSKLAAAILKGLTEVPIEPGSIVLYLGASTGTTPSHVSDIIGSEGTVFCIEFAPRSMRDLVAVCESRENMVPILADARKPEQYAEAGNVDAIYMDVAQPDQSKIMIDNGAKFLETGGAAMIAIKSQSIDVTLPPEKVYERVISELEPHFEILQKLVLDPFDKDHMFLLLRKK